MAIVNFYIPQVTERVYKRLESALKVIGAEGVSWASDRLRANKSVITSNLINSLAYSTETFQSPVKKGKVKPTKANPTGKTSGTPIALAPKLAVHIGSNVFYAPYVEFGTSRSPAKSYLRAGILANKSKILKRFALAVNG